MEPCRHMLNRAISENIGGVRRAPNARIQRIRERVLWALFCMFNIGPLFIIGGALFVH